MNCLNSFYIHFYNVQHHAGNYSHKIINRLEGMTIDNNAASFIKKKACAGGTVSLEVFIHGIHCRKLPS